MISECRISLASIAEYPLVLVSRHYVHSHGPMHHFSNFHSSHNLVIEFDVAMLKVLEIVVDCNLRIR